MRFQSFCSRLSLPAIATVLLSAALPGQASSAQAELPPQAQSFSAEAIATPNPFLQRLDNQTPSSWLDNLKPISAVESLAQLSPEASAYDSYHNLLQVLTCPQDRSQYGDFYDYGYWGGGAWCGQTGSAGYWVWVAPDWYIWGDMIPEGASAYNQYYDLQQVLYCPSDADQYGEYSNYGYWGGGAWCGETGVAGYWVWVYPNWYVWDYEIDE